MTDKCNEQCNEHSGLTIKVEHVAKRQDDMHSLLTTINTRVILTLGGVIASGLFFFLNFLVKYFAPVSAVAKVIK